MPFTLGSGPWIWGGRNLAHLPASFSLSSNLSSAFIGAWAKAEAAALDAEEDGRVFCVASCKEVHDSVIP
jgi:hypothetical protein